MSRDPMNRYPMTRLRLLVPPREADAPGPAAGAADIFRRFFALIERFECPPQRSEARPAPEIKARITRLDPDPHRKA